MKKTTSSSSSSQSNFKNTKSTSGGGATTGSGGSKQVRFGVGQNDDALVIEHIEDNRWDSEEEVAAEDAIILESESDGGPSQATSSGSRTDSQTLGEEFQSVETYLRCPGSLRGAWTIRNPNNINSNAKSDNFPTNTTSGASSTGPNNPEERATGIEFTEFDPGKSIF